MKYLKLFESMTEVEVERICKKYVIENWSINKDGLVDVNGDVNLIFKGLTKLPLQFGRVTGDFWCNSNNLTTLEGAPTEVGETFYCEFNKLTSLVGAPREVGGDFWCYENELTSLEGSPREVGGGVFCHNNNLTILEGGPKEVGGKFLCYNNNLITLKGAPEYIDGKVEFLPNDNLPIEFIFFLELNSNRIDLQTYIIKWQKDYAIWRKDGSFNEVNFIQMMEAAQDELKNIKFQK